MRSGPWGSPPDDPTAGSDAPQGRLGRPDRGSERARDPEGPGVRRIALLGNHVPRRCGIATFTTHLCDAIGEAFPEVDCSVLAVNDVGRRHAYPDRVRFEIRAEDRGSYRRAADFLNESGTDLVCVQHEYGIFGGPAGAHVLALLRGLRAPVVTTLHTVLAEPTPPQRAVMDELVRLSERLVVMSARGVELLRSVHRVPPEKIDRIPHGIPELPPGPSSKERLGIADRRVLLTFGLLSPDKGIEYAIEALPTILARYPDALYVVLGATHPHVRDRQGESYRDLLTRRARDLGVESSVVFHDRFVDQEELNRFLSAADVYVTPYLKAEQITSGTLAYAVGSGKAVISTPYWYASELLAEGRGRLVPWRDSAAIAREAIDLFGDEVERHAMCARAAVQGRDMAWSAVAGAYGRSFERARREHASRRRDTTRTKRDAGVGAESPPLVWDHLLRMTDGTGLLQHAAVSTPRREDGYCLDDNARGLALLALAEDLGAEGRDRVSPLGARYLAFVRHAWSPERGRFRNFLTYDRRWPEVRGSEDSHGRALWALGTVVGRTSVEGQRALALDLFRAALPAVIEFTSPRAWAFALLGLEEYLRAFQGERRVEAVRDLLAERLLDLFERVSEPDWPWFEDRLTYCNARLPQALLASGARSGRADMLEAGLHSLEWLARQQVSPEGDFAPIGSDGFHVRGGPRARFDQQPVEASAMVSACLAAGRATRDGHWALHAQGAFDWFLGRNELGETLYDPSTGGCRDGLHADRVNQNQGAESTLSFLLALLEMRAAGLLGPALPALHLSREIREVERPSARGMAPRVRVASLLEERS